MYAMMKAEFIELHGIELFNLLIEPLTEKVYDLNVIGNVHGNLLGSFLAAHPSIPSKDSPLSKYSFKVFRADCIKRNGQVKWNRYFTRSVKPKFVRWLAAYQKQLARN